MVSKGPIGIIAAGAAVAIVFLVMTASGGLLQPPTQEERELAMQEVVLNLRSVDVISVDEQEAVIEVSFDAFNPNQSSVVLESIQYILYANGVRLGSSEIGERAEGFVTGSGKSFTMYREYSFTLSDDFEVRKNDRTETVWSELQNDNVEWRVTGNYYYTDPVRAGAQELTFDFTT